MIKLYHEEVGTVVLDQLLQEHEPVIVISDLSIIEMISAFARKVRTQDMTEDTFERVVASFEKDVLDFEVISIDQEVKNHAVALLKKYGLKQGLRTLDALQLASALSGGVTISLDKFIAADKTLISVTEEESLSGLLV